MMDSIIVILLPLTLLGIMGGLGWLDKRYLDASTKQMEDRKARAEEFGPITRSTPVRHKFWYMDALGKDFEWTPQEADQFRLYINRKGAICRPLWSISEDCEYITRCGSLTEALPYLHKRIDGTSMQYDWSESTRAFEEWAAALQPEQEEPEPEPAKRNRMERMPRQEGATDPGIYLLEIGEVFYYGQSRHLNRRERDHLRDLTRGRHSNQYLQDAFNVEGIDGFSFTVVERCRINELDRKEQKLIERTYDDENCANKQRTVTHRARRAVS
jgi:hypothetical protein